ncbi:MAG: hypothetical protein M9934_04275 [Thermomicrobiales bacterium]|nr:hypothetical protein [Thermomicrobiales bacterium]
MDRHDDRVTAMHFPVNARQTSHGWELPYPVEQLALWVRQRWKWRYARELKSGWGLGDQQQWSGLRCSDRDAVGNLRTRSPSRTGVVGVRRPFGIPGAGTASVSGPRVT